MLGELVRTAIRNFDTLHFQALLATAAANGLSRRKKPSWQIANRSIGRARSEHAGRYAELLRHCPESSCLVIFEEYAQRSTYSACLGTEPPC